jgi:toxin ParE1/3/4
MARYTIRPRTWREIKAHVEYLEDHAGVETAERFIDCLISTFENLARMPRQGVRCSFSKPALKRLHRWPVTDFESWLIFYFPKRDGVEIVHVIHGARDMESLL